MSNQEPNPAAQASSVPATPGTTVTKTEKLTWKNLEDFALSLLIVLIFPLLPIIAGLWRTRGQLETAELMLASSMYALGAGVASESRLVFIFTMLGGVLFGIAYGFEKGQGSPLPASNTVGYISIVVVFVMYTIERIIIHLFLRKKFRFPGNMED